MTISRFISSADRWVGEAAANFRPHLTGVCISLLGLVGNAFADDPLPEFGVDDYQFAPLRVHLLASPDRPELCTTLTEADIARIITKANGVWSQAGIGFYVESIIREAPAPSDEPGHTAPIPSHLLLSLIRRESFGADVFNVYYLKDFGVNGIYFPKAIFVKDTASLRPVKGGIDEPIPRVTSHELGHASAPAPAGHFQSHGVGHDWHAAECG